MSSLDIRPTLVMGASGSVGRHVLDGLLDAGLPVRASARKPVADRFPGGLDLVAADLTDPSSLAAAFAGVGRVFLYAQRDGVDGVIAAARDAGIERIVLLSSGSVIHPTSRGNAIAEEHREIEKAYAAAEGLRVIPIRPLVLAANALNWTWSIKAAGSVALYRPDAITAPIHERDIAGVALAALTTDAVPAVGGPLSGILTGPDRISQRDQVAEIASAIGTPVDVVELDRGAALTQLSKFMPGAEADAVLRFLDDADAGNSPATGVVENLLGRPATPFRSWALDHADDFR